MTLPTTEMCREMISRYQRSAEHADRRIVKQHFNYWVNFWRKKLKQAEYRERLPEPRKDGRCTGCKKKATSHDGRFCHGCFIKHTKEERKDSYARICEHADRKQVDLKSLGGTAEMQSWEDD